MGQKAITIYTPPSAGAHINAEDDAQLNRARFGGSGITLADGQLALTIVDDNTVRLASGQYSNQGYMISVLGGTTEDLAVESGTAGSYRHDLVVADFIRGGGDTPDTHVFRVLTGTDASSAAAAADPTLIQTNLGEGGAQRQEALYRLIINGTTLAAVERVADFVGNVYQ